jgi:exopolyphosphatase/guanosine-5'-triphosphate,3'-diphosphate pyrophosphatase
MRMKIAALDLGSNTFHMLVASVDRRGAVLKLGSKKEALRLAGSMLPDGTIPEPSLTRALNTIGGMLELARELGAERIVAVGTSALRDARNGGELVVRAKDSYGLDVEILSGEEEGRLVYRGAMGRLASAASRAVVIDLGGGSVELAVGEDGVCLGARTLPLGFLRVARTLGLSDTLDRRALGTIEQYVRLQAAQAATGVEAFAPAVWVLSGGTARAIGQLALSLGAGELSSAGFQRLAGHLATRDPEHLRTLGVDPERIAGFNVGIAVLAALVNLVRAAKIDVSSGGLRDGLVLRAHERAERLGSSPPSRRPRSDAASAGWGT